MAGSFAARIAGGFANTGLDVAFQVLQPVAHRAGANLDERYLAPAQRSRSRNASLTPRHKAASFVVSKLPCMFLIP